MVTSAHALTPRPWPREAAVRERRPVRPARSRQAGEWLLDAGAVLVLAYALPFVIILVGAPIALIVSLLLWLGGGQ